VAAQGGPKAVEVRQEAEIYDIYLLPPSEDSETCQTWLRMRNRDGRYSLMFEEWVAEGPFIISPRITFEVPPAAAPPRSVEHPALTPAPLRPRPPHTCT
jgi:hypothetical protein